MNVIPMQQKISISSNVAISIWIICNKLRADVQSTSLWGRQEMFGLWSLKKLLKISGLIEYKIIRLHKVWEEITITEKHCLEKDHMCTVCLLYTSTLCSYFLLYVLYKQVFPMSFIYMLYSFPYLALCFYLNSFCFVFLEL